MTKSIKSRTSYARVVYFSYDKQNFGVASNTRKDFADADELLRGVNDRREKEPFPFGIIEKEIVSLDVQKNIRSVSANFSISLLPTSNWKQIIKPGDWILLYLFDEPPTDYSQDTQNLVLVGNVDRISRVREKDEETDKTLLRYRISGRNFGKVFENTDLFFDPYMAKNQSNTLDAILRTKGLPLAGSPDIIVGKLFDIFLGDGGKKDPVTQPTNQ